MCAILFIDSNDVHATQLHVHQLPILLINDAHATQLHVHQLPILLINVNKC